MPNVERGRSIAVLMLGSAGALSVVVIGLSYLLGLGLGIPSLQALAAFGLGAFAYRGTRWALLAYGAVALASSVHAAWLWSNDARILSPLWFVACLVWLNVPLASITSPDLRAFFARRGAAETAPAKPWRARIFEETATVVGVPFAASVAVFWVVSYWLGGTRELFVPNSVEARPFNLPFSAVSVVVLAVAALLGVRGSGYGRGILTASSAWFALGTADGVRRAASPSPWIPDLDWGLPTGLSALVLFAAVCTFSAIPLGVTWWKHFKPGSRDDRLRLGFGLVIGLATAGLFGRPALHTCRTQYARQPSEMSTWTDRRTCGGFCAGRGDSKVTRGESRSDSSGHFGKWGGCDWDACREAMKKPCEELSGRQCIPERECRTVAY